MRQYLQCARHSEKVTKEDKIIFALKPALQYIVNVPLSAPTAPKFNDFPSIILASHSISPRRFKLDPNPAFVKGES